MTDQTSGEGTRDLLYELHMEECAHGATLRRLDRLRSLIIHAKAALDAELYGEAWEALRVALDEAPREPWQSGTYADIGNINFPPGQDPPALGEESR